MQKEVATFFISLFVHVTLSKLIRVVYPEENNDLNQLWEQQSVNQLFRGFPLGRLLEHKEKLRIKQVLSRNDKCSLFPVPRQELRFKLVRNTEWGNWELVTNCWGFFWTAALWGNSLQELSQGTAIPQRWVPWGLCCSGSLGEDPWAATHGGRSAQRCRAWVWLRLLGTVLHPSQAKEMKMSVRKIQGSKGL